MLTSRRAPVNMMPDQVERIACSVISVNVSMDV
jgi:hypothetical protein